jgi:hypothetical protein
VRFQPKTGQAGLLLMLGLVTAVLFSCSGTPGDADDVVDRMIGAYGGPERIELMKNFVGKGFMKDQLGQAVVRNWPYDHFQRDTMLKTKVALIEKGIAYNIRYATYDGFNYRVANKNGDSIDRPPVDISLIKYRFPLIFDWLRNTELEGDITDNGDKSGICKIEYPGPVYSIEIGVSRGDWLLRYVRFENQKDSTRVFSEAYTDYWKVDGVPFPSRFTGKFQDMMPYYEYYFTKIELGADLPDSTFILNEEELALIPEKGTKPAE